MEKEEVVRGLEKEQLIRGCEKIIDRLAEEEEITERIMIPSVRHAIGAAAWIALSDEQRMETMRDLFRAFKAGFNVKLVDDRMTREDLQHVRNAIDHLNSDEEYKIHNAIIHLESILKEYKEPQRNTSTEE